MGAVKEIFRRGESNVLEDSQGANFKTANNMTPDRFEQTLIRQV
jgi:hypothetical protein